LYQKKHNLYKGLNFWHYITMCNEKKITVVPSILSADFANLASALKDVEASGCTSVHLDVMDGHFVPQLTFGPKTVADLRKQTGLYFDTHLMIDRPGDFIKPFADAGSDAITVHVEAGVMALQLLEDIRAMGKEAGISIAPSTPAQAIFELLPVVDLVLVMTVNPGYGGQALIPSCLDKVSVLRDERERRGLNFRLSVDGGIHPETAPLAIQAGADTLVTGSGFFGAQDKEEYVKKMKEIKK
jgi:ribulose-phosphate 3-epimerase